MKYKNRIVMIAMIILIIILSVANIYVTLKVNGFINNNSNSIQSILHRIDAVEGSIKSIPELHNGYTPVKGKDYFDGKDGKNARDGIDSKSLHTIEKEIIIKEIPLDGKDGITPHLRCNMSKNRWEASYNNMLSYQIVKDENGDQSKCIMIL